MRAVSCNPLTLCRRLRSEEISQELGRHDAVALQGTQMKWRGGADVPKQTLPNHDALHWGWGRGGRTNKACGVSIFFKKGCKVLKLLSPPPALRGRGGGARLRRGTLDILVLALYFPVRGVAVQRVAADALFTWAQRCLMETPTRCTPLLCADLDDGLGTVKHEAVVFSPLSEAIGQEWELATVSTFFEDYTFSGPTGARSRPDVIAMPRELMPSVADCKPLYTIGDRLQAIRARGRRARAPLGASVMITPVHPEILPRSALAQWDMDACMLAPTRHQGKLEFLTELEYKCEDMVRPPLDEEQGPGEAWGELAEAARKTGLAHFGLKGRGTRGMEEVTEQRKKLLQERADIRRRHVLEGEMRASTDFELDRCVQELEDATRRLRALQRQQRRRLRAVRCEALAEAERVGDAAAVWRLAHLLGERGLGARRRAHRAPRLEHARCSALNAKEAALEDLEELEGQGIGYRAGPPSMEVFRGRMLRCLALVRLFKTAPLAWPRSRAADVVRVIHMMHPVGKGYTSVLAARAQKVKAAPNDFGFAPRRSRGGALAVAAAVAERAARYGLAALASFKDLSKAFQCPSARDMAQGLQGMARAEDHPIVSRRVLDYHCEVETAEGALRMKTNQGALIGDSIGEVRRHGTVLDLSLTKPADDLCKRFVWWRHDTAIKNHKASDELLDRLLEPRGFQHDIPKQCAMCAFRGEGARAKTRAFFAGRLGVRGNCSTVARCLGPMLHCQGGLATGIRARAAAATRGFADMGRRWKSEVSVE
ncbi:unnamed protein product, partial [Prorocentrum cordatum]